MKIKVRRILAVALTLIMLLSLVAAFPLNAGAEFDNDTKSGVVAIVFYLKDAGYYIPSGDNNYRRIQDIGDTDFGGGSGFFIGEEKENPQYIVTNCHVVASYIAANEGETFLYYLGTQDSTPVYIGALKCEMRVYYDKDDYDVAYIDGKSYGSVDKIDLAVLKLQKPTTKRHALVLETPTDDMVGDTIYTVGYPGNADNGFTSANKYGVEDATVHKGIINKFVVNDKGVRRIAIDATVQHGNSGGPLISENGTVLGVNTNVESNSPYENQIEADYYALNTSELKDFLDKNSVKYMDADKGGGSGSGGNASNSGSDNSGDKKDADKNEKKDGGLDPLVLILIIAGAVVLIAVAGIIAYVVLKRKRDENGRLVNQPAPAPMPSPMQNPERPAPLNYGATTAPTATKGLVRSSSSQHVGKVFYITENPVMIGRNAAECMIAYEQGTPGVSGRHCMLSYDGLLEQFTLTDVGSSFGTFLSDGTKLQPNVPVKLMAGDSFYVGDKANVLTLDVEK